MGDSSDRIEAAIQKKGVELFREILRVLETADVEDYYTPDNWGGKVGIWRDDLMRLDLQLVDAHRMEAGAPDPPPLEDVPIPELPEAEGGQQGVRPMGMGVVLPAWGAGLVGATTERLPPGAAEALAARIATLKAAAGRLGLPGLGLSLLASSSPVEGAAGGAAGGWAANASGASSGSTSDAAAGTSLGSIAAAGGQPPAPSVVELRLITLFVSKWKLDAGKTKTFMSCLTPPRRRFVIQNFKGPQGATDALDATDALEAYILECEATNAWEGAEKTAVLISSKLESSSGVVSPASIGYKRPLATPSLGLTPASLAAAGVDPSKKPRWAPPANFSLPNRNASPVVGATAAANSDKLRAFMSMTALTKKLG